MSLNEQESVLGCSDRRDSDAEGMDATGEMEYNQSSDTMRNNTFASRTAIPALYRWIFAAHGKIFDEGHESTRYRCAGHMKWGPHSAFLLGALGMVQAQPAQARPCSPSSLLS